MNVKCPNAGKLACNREDCGLHFKCRRGVIQGVEIPTADLIAELEKQRPDCKKCPPIPNINGDHSCDNCIWLGKSLGTDNFKGAK